MGARPFVVFIILSLLFSVPVFAGDTARFEGHLTKGVLSLDQKEYQKAADSFKAALEVKPDDPSATLYLGVALSKSGNEKEAETFLKKAVSLDPQSPRANFELGVLYYQKGNYHEAKDFFETTKALSPKGELSGPADAYIAEIEKSEREAKKEGQKNWALGLSVGEQYDSNVILEPSDGALPEGISGKSDWRTVFYLDGRYSPLMKDNFSIDLTYSFYQSLQSKLDDFNVQQHLPGILISYAVMKDVLLRLDYTFEFTTVDYETYLLSHSIQPVITIAEGKGFFTNLRYRFQQKDFRDTNLFETNSQRDGENHLFGITQYIQLHKAVLASIGYAYDRDLAEKDYWRYNGNAGEAYLRFDFGRGWTGDLWGQYYSKNYKGEFPGTERKRRDTTRTFTANLTKSLHPKISITAGYLYERNSSNISFFEYDRDIVTLMVRVQL
jgi:tetratricopeptide (TPR) repeat protein